MDRKKCYFCNMMYFQDRMIEFENGRHTRKKTTSFCCPVCIKSKTINDIKKSNRKRDAISQKISRFKIKHELKEVPKKIKEVLKTNYLLNEKSKRLK